MESGLTVSISYNGKSLASFQQVYWRVAAWDQNGTACGWSETAFWEMGVLSVSDWGNSTWIQRAPAYPAPQDQCSQFHSNDPAPIFRTAFTQPGEKTVARARVYIAGLGYYIMTINGGGLE